LYSRYYKLAFYSLWLALNLIQSFTTGLFDDESYYWVYSKFLDWGYFDHPPMIALLIKMGSAILPGEVGVRLFIAIMSTCTLWLIEKLLVIKDDKMFYAITISMAVLQLGGIIAVPDIPLLFFTTLFFLAYKRFVQAATFTNSFLLALCIAALLYSKYHGLLVVALTLASNPKLFTKRSTYLVGVFSLLLFIPHLYWQYAHDFPSAQYHFKDRISRSYQSSFTFDYIFQQLLLMGPLATIVILWAAIRSKPTDELQRALKFTTFGFYLFFLLYSFRGYIEANWTFPAFIGLIVLSHQYLSGRAHLRKLINILAICTFILTTACRFYLAGCLPPMDLKDDEFLFNKEWTEDIDQRAGGLPVFFVDSYQRASKYWFYSGKPAYSLNTLDYRRNGFSLWTMEDSLQHKKMYGVYQGKHNDYFKDSIPTKKGVFLGRIFDNYFSFSRILFASPSNVEGNNGDSLQIPVNCLIDEDSYKRIHPLFDTARVWMAIYSKDVDEPIVLPTSFCLGELTEHKQQVDVPVRLKVSPGSYAARFGISSCVSNWPTINSTAFSLKVK
jgi:hypothetical protein